MMSQNNGNMSQVERVRFVESQFLRARELNGEQAYRIDRQRRHQIAHHSWGIVYGLTLVDVIGGIDIQPGLAVDGYGRSLILAKPFPTITYDQLQDSFPEIRPRVLDIWLFYAREEVVQSESKRWHEDVSVKLTIGQEPITPQRPPNVPRGDYTFPPYLPPSDNPNRIWPVYLGRAVRQSESGTVFWQTQQEVERHYASHVGNIVFDPKPTLESQARMQLIAAKDGNGKRFAISRFEKVEVEKETTIQEKECLTINRQGQTQFHGGLNLPANSLTTNGLRFEEMKKPPETAVPWQIYATEIPIENQPTQHQLRFELLHPGDKGDPAHFQAVIGYPGTEESFAQCLTVDADGTVRVHGNLTLEDGQIIEGPITADSNDPRFAGAILSNWVHGQAAAADHSNAFHQTSFSLTLDFEQTKFDSLQNITYEITFHNDGKTVISNLKLFEVLSTPNFTTPALPLDGVEINELDPNSEGVTISGFTVPSRPKSIPRSFFSRKVTVTVIAQGVVGKHFPRALASRQVRVGS